MTTIAELGEFGLIARLTAGLAQSGHVIAGVGDDAAILDIGGDQLIVATCDAQVADTHFRLSTMSPQDIGRRSLAVNLSDIAAMGATPRFALVSLLAPPTLAVAILDGIYAGLQEEATRFSVAIVGGNVARSDQLIIDITLLGTGQRGQLLRRNAAHPGETLLVTGSLGSAAAGLLVMEDAQLAAQVEPTCLVDVLAAQRTPTPHVAAGQWLAKQGIKTGIDISDGLAADIAHLCDMSAVGVRIDAASLPIRPEVALIAHLAGRTPIELALSGGEDYELIFTCAPEQATSIAQGLFDATGVRATAIGTILAETELVLFDGKQLIPLAAHGWDHLRQE